MGLERTGKIGTVAGASNANGRGIALALAKEGAHVVLHARRAEPLEDAHRQLAVTGSAVSHALDVRDIPALEAFLQHLAVRNGRLEIVVNYAGTGPFAPVDQITYEQWHESFRLNFDVPFASLREALPHIQSSGGGAILNIPPILGARLQTMAAAYGVVKVACGISPTLPRLRPRRTISKSKTQFRSARSRLKALTPIEPPISSWRRKSRVRFRCGARARRSKFPRLPAVVAGIVYHMCMPAN